VALPDVDSLLADGAPARFELQAGTFPTESAARRFAADLGGSGLAEVQPTGQDGQTVWRVIVRGLSGPAEAAAARNQAIALGAPRALIVGGS
jgi:cell division protein FtsN